MKTEIFWLNEAASKGFNTLSEIQEIDELHRRHNATMSDHLSKYVKCRAHIPDEIESDTNKLIISGKIKFDFEIQQGRISQSGDLENDLRISIQSVKIVPVYSF